MNIFQHSQMRWTCCSCGECLFASRSYSPQPHSRQSESESGRRSAKGFGPPFRCNHGQVAPGILVHLDGLKERLEVSRPEALKTEETPVQISHSELRKLMVEIFFANNQKIKCWWFVWGSLWCGSISSYARLSSFPSTSAHPGEWQDAPVLTGRMGAGCHKWNATRCKPKERFPLLLRLLCRCELFNLNLSVKDLLSFYKWAGLMQFSPGGSCKQVFRHFSAFQEGKMTTGLWIQSV